MLHWTTYLALKGLFPTRRRLSFFTLMSVMGVTLGVMVLLIVQSVVNGLGLSIREPIRHMYGDLRLEAIGGSMPEDSQFLADIQARPEVERAGFYAMGPVLIQHLGLSAFPQLLGMEVSDAVPPVLPVKLYLRSGIWQDLAEEDTVLVGEALAQQLALQVGSVIEVYTPLMLEKSTQQEVLLPREARVVGVFRTGFAGVDNQVILSGLSFLQGVYDLEDRVHGLVVFLKKEEDLPRTVGVFNEAFRGQNWGDPHLRLRASPWTHMAHEILSMLRTEKVSLFFVLVFIMLVASFAIAVALSLSVVRKRREIGLLRAMGATPGEVARIFCLQGAMIGVLGWALGAAGALIVLHFRDFLAHGIAYLTHSQDAFRIYYQNEHIPVGYLGRDFGFSALFACLMCTVAGLVPAWQAAGIQPAGALRSEG